MEIELPSGCNVYYGDYIDNYQGSTRRRYYLDNYNLVLNSVSNNTNQPTNVVCMSAPLLWRPELSIEFSLASFGLCLVALFVLAKLVFRHLWVG